MLTLEEGFLRHARREIDDSVDLLVSDAGSSDPDLMFVEATDWLMCEGGCSHLPELAASSRSPLDGPARTALAALADSAAELPEEAFEAATRAYYEEVGYPATIAGGLVALCDLFFGRILSGAVHPVIGAGCISRYWWMTEGVPDRMVVHRCRSAWDRWIGARDAAGRAAEEATIRSLASDWVSHHQSRVPMRSSAQNPELPRH